MSSYSATAQNFFTYSNGSLLRTDSLDNAYLNHLDSINFYDTLYKLEISDLSTSFFNNSLLVKDPIHPSSLGTYLFVYDADFEDDENYYWYGQSKILYGDTSCVHAKLSILREDDTYSGQMVFDTNTYIIKTLPSGATAMFLSKAIESTCVSIPNDSITEYDLEMDDLTDIQARSQLCFVDVLIVASAQAAARNPAFMVEIREGLMESNVALARSSVPNLRFRLANPAPVLLPANYQFFVESAPERNIAADVMSFRNTFQNDQFPNVGWHRNENRADIVILLTSGRYFTGGGQAFGIAGTLLADSENAFAVIDVNNIRRDKTLAHEMAHILGARHEGCTGLIGIDNAGCNPGPGQTQNPALLGEAFARAHIFGRWTRSFLGFKHRWRDYRTIMHTSPLVDDEKKNIWLDNYSNPNIRVHNNPTGIANVSDNSRLLRNVACMVSDFRDEEIPTDLTVSTDGPYLVCPCSYIFINSEINGSSIPSGATYLWELSFNGVNYTTVGTGSTLGYYHECEGRFEQAMIFKLTVSFPGVDPLVRYHHVEIGSTNDQGTPCIIWRPTSIEDQNAIQNFTLNVFPNPIANENELFLQLTIPANTAGSKLLEELKTSHIVVTDISGKVIEQHPTNIRLSNTTISIPVSNLIPGVYMISMTFNNGTQISSKFVKQ